MPISPKIIRVPVKLVDGQWEILYGGPVRVADGAFGELHLHKVHFDDPEFLRAFTQKRRIEILPEGTELRVALSIRNSEPNWKDHLVGKKDTPHVLSARVGDTTSFVRIWLAGATRLQLQQGVTGGGLRLVLEGMEPRAIESGTVRLPEILDPAHADSLNHAFTRLSELFEPWRQSHTGSIYERVFYLDSDRLWHPLGDLRNRSLAEAERNVIKALWARVAEALGTALL